MGKQRILLKHRIYVALIWWHVVYNYSVKVNVSLIRRLKSADNSQSCRFSASRRTNENNKFLILNFKSEIGILYVNDFNRKVLEKIDDHER